MLEDEWGSYRLDRNFSSKGKQFVFNLDTYTCYRISTGTCSIDEVGIQIKEDPYASSYSVEYCPNLAASLNKFGVINQNYPIRVIKNTCGHYSIEDGQHRLCSAAKLGITLEVYVLEDESDCDVCYWKKKSLKFRVLSRLGKNRYFLRKL